MKKINLSIIVSFILSLFLFASCEKEETAEGKAYYRVTQSDIKSNGTEDMQNFMLIEQEFSNQLSAMTGVVIEDGKYVLSGKYSTCDLAVEKACKRAEENLYNIPLEGNITYKVTATYDKNSEQKVIYTHTFGNK